MKKLSICLMAISALVACHPDENSPEISASSKTNDLGCDINLPQSAIHVIGLSLDEAVSFLLEKGWQETGDKLNNERRTFICQDSSMVLAYRGEYVPGPRTSLVISVVDGHVYSSHINSNCYPNEEPFHHLAEWDVYIRKELKSYDHWKADFSGMSINKSYSDFNLGDHMKFYSDLKKTKEEDITQLSFTYEGKMHINVGASIRSGWDINDPSSFISMVNIGMTVALNDK